MQNKYLCSDIMNIYMREHLVQCIEKGHFLQFPKSVIGKTRTPTILKT
jgi:hypothetical protein